LGKKAIGQLGTPDRPVAQSPDRLIAKSPDRPIANLPDA
jgi:hypothetical protein